MSSITSISSRCRRCCANFQRLVKLEYKWSDQQLTFLMRHARNDFSRWDAAQSLLATYIKLNVNRHQQGQPLSLPVHVADAFRAILLDEKIRPALAAEILTLPSANEIAEMFAIIDPIAIATVREALTRTSGERAGGRIPRGI